MQELIKIKKEQNGIETINARDLHEFLESRRDFSTWIKQRIESYGFIENEDYTTLTQKVERAIRIDYHISIDMAKELSMVENNEKGKQARRYFIAREKQAKALEVPQTFAEALRLAANQQEQIEAQSKLLLEQKPKVEFANAVLGSQDSIDMGSVAKVLNKNIGRNRLFQLLRDKKVLQQNNIPYQAMIDRGYFRTIEQKYTKPDGSIHISIKTMVYQKGVAYINKIMEAE